MQLLLFNPEHDYALADNSPHFVALRSAAQFAHDCAPFMRYLAEREVRVCDAYRPYGKDFQKNFAPMEDAARITKVTPWGWDAAAVYQLRRIGIPEGLLPGDSQVAKLRELAHRKTTIAAMEFLHDRHPHPEKLPAIPEYITEIQEVEDFVRRVPDAIFKSPYSGNGRGHLYAHATASPTLLRQCEGVLKRQGALLAERQYTVIQDFAMEFSCDAGEVRFRGYSLFRTAHYGYGGNLLLPDEEILRRLAQYIDIEEIERTQMLAGDFLRQEIAPHYDGYAGVDMFVYQEDGAYRIHPFVEVNLRMTMGLAAHEIFARYCHPDSRGMFRIVRAAGGTTDAGLLQPEPMRLRDGLWWKGAKALHPVTADTQYAVVVEI